MAASPPSSPVVRLALETRQVVRDGADQLVSWELRLPAGASRARQLVHGFWLPVVLGRLMLLDPRVRRRWLRYCGWQSAAVVVATALVMAVAGGKLVETKRQGSSGAEEALEDVRRAVTARAESLEQGASPEDRAAIELEAELVDARLDWAEERVETSIESGVAPEEALHRSLRAALDERALKRTATRKRRAREDRDAELATLAQHVKAAVVSGVKPAPAAGKDAGSESLGEVLEREINRFAMQVQDEAETQRRAELKRQVTPLGASAAPATAAALNARAELTKAAFDAEPVAEERIRAARSWTERVATAGIARILALLAALWAALYIGQFIVICLSRDYHSELSREACVLAGIVPEDTPVDPRPNLSLRWMRQRAYRQARGWWVIALGIPVCWFFSLPIPGGWASTLVVAAWVAYWQLVFAAAKSARAWIGEDSAPDPWFVHAWSWLVKKVPLFWWGVPRWYGSLWRRFSRSLFAPAQCVQEQPWAFAGLAAFRLIAALPLVKVFARPIVPVASALLIESHRDGAAPRG